MTTTSGAYASQTHDAIDATYRLLVHVRAFLHSECTRMWDPLSSWGDELDKPAAQRKLTWLVQMAISRKGGQCLDINDATAGASRNHRGRPNRKESADYQRSLGHDARALNTPRLRIYSITTPELRGRFADRIVTREE